MKWNVCLTIKVSLDLTGAQLWSPKARPLSRVSCILSSCRTCQSFLVACKNSCKLYLFHFSKITNSLNSFYDILSLFHGVRHSKQALYWKKKTQKLIKRSWFAHCRFFSLSKLSLCRRFKLNRRQTREKVLAALWQLECVCLCTCVCVFLTEHLSKKRRKRKNERGVVLLWCGVNWGEGEQRADGRASEWARERFSNWLSETKAHSTLWIEIALESRAGECDSKYWLIWILNE